MNILDQVTGITLLWPRMLWLLALLPVLAWLHFRLAARRQRLHDPLPGLRAAAESGSAGGSLRRTVPPLLLLVALVVLLAAVSRPQAVVTLPSMHEDVVLALDTSGSMRATDVQPTRLAAAQGAARSFVERRPPRTRVGIVSVAGAANVVQSLTSSGEELLQAIDRLQPQRGTALGSGIYVALATLLPDAGIDMEAIEQGRPSAAGSGTAQSVAPGSNRSVAIVLLSDGESNHGPDPLEAAKRAAEHGVRIHTVGIGTPEGIPLSFAGASMRVRLDEDTLRKIADTTLGEYFVATSGPELQRVYEHLSARMAVERARTVEITALFVAAGALLLAVSAVCSMMWFNRVA